MKNSISKFSVLLIAIIMSQITYGQTVIGIEAGANLVDPKSTDFDQTIGYHVGLTFDFPFSNVFSFETGMFYSKKNIEDAYGDELRLGYIDIPLTLKASFQMT